MLVLAQGITVTVIHMGTDIMAIRIDMVTIGTHTLTGDIDMQEEDTGALLVKHTTKEADIITKITNINMIMIKAPGAQHAKRITNKKNSCGINFTE